MPESMLFGGLATVRIQKGMLFGPWNALDMSFRSTLTYCGVLADVPHSETYDWRDFLAELALQRSTEVWGMVSSSAIKRGLAWQAAILPQPRWLKVRPQAAFSQQAQAIMRQRAYRWAKD